MSSVKCAKEENVYTSVSYISMSFSQL